MKTKKKLSPYKKFAALSDAQKESVYQECDDPNIALQAKPLDPRMTRLWKHAKNKGGRPRVGQGATRVLISIERTLLADADRFARQHHMTRSQLFSDGIKNTLAKAG